MAKDPAFLFYSQDFYTGVATLNWEDRGKYISILCLMHQQGRMSEETIRFIVGSVSDNLKSKFSIDDHGMWFNERLEDETHKRNKFTESRRNNGLLGGRPSDTKPTGKPKNNLKVNLVHNHKANLMEDENENEIKDINTKEPVDFFLEVKNKGGDIYTDEMLKRFSEYWTETITKGANKGKPAWRGEKKWDLGRRLSAWAQRNLDGIVCYKEDDKSITDKRIEFKASLKPFLEKYGKDLINNFYLHWGQPENTKAPKKLNWELEESWHLESRIINWENRDFKKANGKGEEKPVYRIPQ